MQFSTIYAQVGNLTSSTAVANDKQFVNEAYQDINQRRRWSWLQSSTTVALVAGQRVYKILGTTPVVTDFDGPISVTLVLTTSGATRKLPRADGQFFDDLVGHCSTNSEPIVWTIQGDTAATTSATVVQGGQQSIVVGPPPVATAGHGQSIIVRYWRNAASIEMSADSDIPIIPAAYHRMIVTRACAIAMTRSLMFDMAAGFERDFQEQLAAAIEADQAMYSGDNDTLSLKVVPQLDPRVPQTQATYNPAARPLPQAV